MTDVLKILDHRSPFQAGKNYQISKENEKAAMNGLVGFLCSTLGMTAAWSEVIDGTEEWADGKYHVKPDYFLYIQRKGEAVRQWTIEVKTTSYDSFFDNEIVIKGPQVWTCKNEPEKYPNPYILAATDSQFALIPMGSFWNVPARDINFGPVAKKGYLLNCDDYEWHEFLAPLDFTRKELWKSQDK